MKKKSNISNSSYYTGMDDHNRSDPDFEGMDFYSAGIRLLGNYDCNRFKNSRISEN